MEVVSVDGDPHVGHADALGQNASNPPQDRAVGDSLVALGKTWTVSSDEARIKAQYESHQVAEAKKFIAEVERDDGPTEADKYRSIYMEKRQQGHYTWDGEYGHRSLAKTKNMKYFLFLLLRRCHGKEFADEEEGTKLAAKIADANPRGTLDSVLWALGNWDPSVAAKLRGYHEKEGKEPRTILEPEPPT